jgi:gamma-glutamyltranspeptidase/glutathione hydrolase
MVDAERGSAHAGRESGIRAARDLFYKGDPARRMVKALQDLGGLYSDDDFGDYTSPWEEPISTTYRGYEIFTNRTWTQGICLLQALNILENDDLASMGHNSVQAIHLQVESLKLAMADRERYVGDSDFQDIPVDGLLSKEYARLRRGLINPNAALADYPAGDPRGLQAVAGTNGSPAAPRALETPVGGADGTTYLATIDAQGNMVSATPSTFSGLSKGMILGDTGILINNRGCYFWLDPDNANSLQPRKRPRTTPCTFIILKDGKPFMTLGTPGADSQVPSDLQVLNNIIDFGLNLQEAVEAPRFGVNSFPRSPWPHETYSNQLDLEDRVPEGISESLNDLGHRVDRVGPWGVSNGFAPVMVDPESGAYVGGADPRKESVVLGW